MAVQRTTYPTKDANSDQDSIRKFFAFEANEIADVTDNHADEIEYLQNNIIESPNPFYGRFDSLSLLEQAYPTGEENAWAVIDAGTGITPQIAIWDNIGSTWEIAGVTSNPIVYVNNYSSLPGTGASNTWYVTIDNFNTYLWFADSYYQTNISQVQNHRTFFIKEITDGSSSDPGIGQIAFEYDGDFIDHIRFNSQYSNYLDRNKVDLDVGASIWFTIDNITQKKRSKFRVLSINTTSNDYLVEVEKTETRLDFELNDKIEVLIYNQKNSGPERFTASASQTEFILQDAPNNVTVNTNRVPQIFGTDYTLDTATATTKKITFTNALPENSKVEVIKYY